MVNALIELANHPGAVGEVFNIGNDKEVKFVELAKAV